MQFDGLLTLTQAARQVPGRPDVSTLWRWCRKGIRARNGQTIRLEHTRVGGKLFISPDALARFFDATTAADIQAFAVQEVTHQTASTCLRPAALRQAAIELAEARLAAQGS